MKKVFKKIVKISVIITGIMAICMFLHGPLEQYHILKPSDDLDDGDEDYDKL